MNKILATVMLGLWSVTAMAIHPNVYEKVLPLSLDAAYEKVYASLEERRFFVIFEAHMSENMARFKDRWGEEYNRQGLDGIRSLVICNIWYTNQVASLDPTMLALCPLRVVLVEKDGKTRVLFARPTAVAEGSPALPVVKEAEAGVIEAIEQAVP